MCVSLLCSSLHQRREIDPLLFDDNKAPETETSEKALQQIDHLNCSKSPGQFSSQSSAVIQERSGRAIAKRHTEATPTDCRIKRFSFINEGFILPGSFPFLFLHLGSKRRGEKKHLGVFYVPLTASSTRFPTVILT